MLLAVPAHQEVTVSVPSVLQESSPPSSAAASVVTSAVIITNHCATPVSEEQSYDQGELDLPDKVKASAGVLVF